MIKVTNDSNNETITLHIENFINIHNINEIERIWKEQIANKPKIVIFDCSSIQSIDSPAIGMLVKFRQEAFAQHVDFVLDRVSIPLLDLLKITNLSQFFPIKSPVG